MKTMGLAPAYGRDYDNQKAVKVALQAGHDFVITDIGPEYGRYVNLEQLDPREIRDLKVRYRQFKKVVVFKVKELKT